MKINMEVDLTVENLDYIEKVFSQYDESTEEINEIKGRAIIHMYPKSDTHNKNGSLDGFIDALFFEAHIYDVDNNRVYRTGATKDEIQIDVESRVRFFKDLSTMIIINTPIKIRYGQSMTVYSSK
ncbi:hypothetical protein WKH56_19915 [Priestia sp. SB1]|uniref:hypothetical protein n=1 Tax=Priestia sp. SB1 TaxID=3132359 RepID=UPI003173908D